MSKSFPIFILLIQLLGLESFAQVVSIPDKNFLSSLTWKNIDKNKNDKIEVNEALEIDTLIINTSSIYDLTGIEAFANLVYLDFSQNKVKSVDLSKNTKLKYIACSQIDSLSSLNISNCLDLEKLSCFNTRVGNIDVSKFSKLRVLECPLSRRSELDVSKNTNLTDLICLYNRFSTVDLSNNPNLTYLDLSWGRVTSLDVSKNPKLTYLDVSGNTGLTSVCVFDTIYAKSNPKFKKDAAQKWTENCTVTGITNDELEIKNHEPVIHPNPAQNTVHISGTFAHAAFYNSMGQMVLNSSNTTIDIGTLSNGVYHIQIVGSDNTSYWQKLVKE